jgi:hypothetical protein
VLNITTEGIKDYQYQYEAEKLPTTIQGFLRSLRLVDNNNNNNNILLIGVIASISDWQHEHTMKQLKND